MTKPDPKIASLVVRPKQEVAHPAPAQATPGANLSARPRTGRLAIGGLAVVAMFFGGLAYWSASAPIASAAIAHGQIRIETNRKTVQHLEGGIISELRVREGVQVRAGDVLIVLDQTHILATNELLRARIAAARKQVGLVRDERDSVASLLRRGYSNKTRLLALERRLAALEGEIKQDEARLSANADTIKRTQVRAPVSGAVVGLQVHTIGGVIKAGEELLSIVPEKERLVVEARVNPNDIDVVRTGLKAHVHLTPFSTRLLAPVAGTVSSISADRMTDETTGQDYYLARIALRNETLARLDGPALMPGMPVEVAVQTGSRSAISYLLSPLMKSFGRAFREE